MPVRPSILAWGMATPWPKPVEPSCSRSLRPARTVADLAPTRCAARSASCFNNDRLLPPGRAVLIASQSRKSASCIGGYSTLVRPAAPWSLACGRDLVGVWFEPADFSVLAAVDHIELTRRTVLEHQRWRVAEVHQHHRVGNARLRNIDACLGDN